MVRIMDKNHLTWSNVLLTNLLIKDVFPVRLSPTTTTVHLTSLAIFIFVVFHTPYVFKILFHKYVKNFTISKITMRLKLIPEKSCFVLVSLFYTQASFLKVKDCIYTSHPLTSRNHFSWRTNFSLPRNKFIDT